MKSLARIRFNESLKSTNHRPSLAIICLAVAALLLDSLFSSARAVTVFNVTSSSSWTDGTKWDNGLPDAVDDGEIPTGFVALGDGLLTGADIFVQNGGTLRVTSASQVLTGGVINVENGGRLEYNATSGTLAAHNTVNLEDGASIGRFVSDTTTGQQVTADDINIVGLNSTVTFQGTHPGGRFFNFSGALTGDVTSTLIGTSLGTSNGPIGILSATDNTYAGKTIVRSTFGTTRGVLVAQGENPLGTGAAGAVEVENLGTLRLRSNTGVTGTGAIEVQTGGRIEFEGPSSGNTVSLATGTEVGRGETGPVGGSSSDSLTLDVGATVSFSGMNSSRTLTFTGPITGDVTSTINVSNQATNDGAFIFSSAGGNPFDGQITISGDSDADRGKLGATGTTPLGSALAGDVDVQAFGTLRLMTNTGVTSTGIVNVAADGRIEVDSTSSTGNTINMASGSSIGRGTSGPVIATNSDTFLFAAGGTFDLFGAHPSSRKLIIDGPLSGTNVTFTAQNLASFDEEIRISSVAGNALSGQMIVKGDSAILQGALGVVGTSPLGTMDIEVQAFGTLLVGDGALTNQPEITVLEDGTIRFRDAGGSTLTGSLLRGTGLVRSETTTAEPLLDVALRDLTFSDTTVAPGTSAGELTIEASLTTFDLDSIFEVEVGGLGNDLLTVDGDLTLTAGSSIELKSLSGISSGNYVIATYSGSLIGEFGTVIDSLGGGFLYSIDYGSLTNSQITLSLTQVPEPSSLLLLGMGVVGAVLRRRKLRKKS